MPSIQRTMNVYGKAMTHSKRQAHSKVVQLILKRKKTVESAGTAIRPVLSELDGSFWEFLGSLTFRATY